MKIFFRADASEKIGSGHIFRCLTLANAVKNKAKISFVCQEIPDDLEEKIKLEGYDVVKSDQLPEGVEADWVVVDHYGLDQKWERTMRSRAKQIFVIDDLANRQHDCDILLDQNYYDNLTSRYKNLVPSKCELLLGPQYALLRPEFYKIRENIKIEGRKTSNQIRRLHIFFGGGDLTNETTKTLKAIKTVGVGDLQIDVVIGSMNPYRANIVELTSKMPNTTIYGQNANMAQLIAGANFAFGAGGTSALERCYLGLPSAVVEVADNQRENSKALSRLGAIHDLGWHQDVSEIQVAQFLKSIVENPDLMAQMADKAWNLMKTDGATGLSLITKAFEEGLCH